MGIAVPRGQVWMRSRGLHLFLLLLVSGCLCSGCKREGPSGQSESLRAPQLRIVVTDPLANEFACARAPAGTLRVVGQAEPVPCIAVLATEALRHRDEAAVVGGLMAVRSRPDLLSALVSKDRFVR